MEIEALKRRLLWVLYILSLLALAAVVIRLLIYVQHAAMLLAVAVLIAYLLAPVVQFIQMPRTFMWRGWKFRKPGVPRLLAILIVYAMIAAMLGLTISYVYPVARNEFIRFTENFSNYQMQFQIFVEQTTLWLAERLPEGNEAWLPDYIRQASSELQQWGLKLVSGSMPALGKFFSTVATFMVLPLLTLFVLLDVDVYKRGFMHLIPARRKRDTLRLLQEIDQVIGNFIRGQMVVAIVMGTSIAIALKLLGIPYALILGIFAGIVDIIPYLGVPLGMIPAFLVALSTHGFGWALLTIAVMEILHMTEGKVVVPTVVGRSVKLPPLVVVVSLMIGAELMGIIGLLIAVPVAGIIRVIINHYLPAEEPRHNPVVPEAIDPQALVARPVEAVEVASSEEPIVPSKSKG